jgi:hypothetical protein
MSGDEWKRKHFPKRSLPDGLSTAALIALLTIVGAIEWIVYRDSPEPPGFSDNDAFGWPFHRSWMEETYNLRRRYKPGCIILIFAILIGLGFLIGRSHG